MYYLKFSCHNFHLVTVVKEITIAFCQFCCNVLPSSDLLNNTFWFFSLILVILHFFFADQWLDLWLIELFWCAKVVCGQLWWSLYCWTFWLRPPFSLPWNTCYVRLERSQHGRECRETTLGYSLCFVDLKHTVKLCFYFL